MRKILITGASGLLGFNLAQQTVHEHQVVAIYHDHSVSMPGCEWYRCDLTDKNQIAQCLSVSSPDVIVHCAAIADVESCEVSPELGRRLHVEAAEILADWAHQHDATIVYISTDSVFDGRTGQYGEEDTPMPLNQYAHSKLAGENAVRARMPKALILRTNFYGWSVQEKLSLGEWILRGLARRERLNIFGDVLFSPLLVNDLARIILDLVALRATGIYHVGAVDHCSKYQFALLLGKIFGLSTELIVPTSVDDFSFKARRPKNTSLAVEKVSKALGRQMPSIREGLQSFKALMEAGYVADIKGRRPRWLPSVGSR